MHITIGGAVQGVGFRPFVYRLASSLGLSGWVTNSSHGVVIEAEGEHALLESFLLRLERERPPLASIASLEFSLLDLAGCEGFTIRPSSEQGSPTAVVLPDIATCSECRAELFDSGNRRSRYPFTNCTNCGPRYSIIHSLPYDRPGTSMQGFTMCPECSAEYHDPANRRFHAQPNACPACGPWLELWDRNGRLLSAREKALEDAAIMLRAGNILAVKGMGGFHLMCSAREDEVVRRLRTRKHREEKPLALMVGDLGALSELCEADPLEERLLRSPESPIVLLRRREGAAIAPSVAPGNPSLGVMLPYTPLHHLLLRECAMPLVATSGNLSDEPICIDEREAVARLGTIADAFLVHNRPILRQIDDSVVRVVLGRELVLRRARGYAPLPVEIPLEVPDLLAVGAQLKSAVAVARGTRVFLSQHLGDLESAESRQAFERETRSLQALYQIAPTRVVSDLHPDYLSTVYARSSGLPIVSIQHHYAHIASCMAENGLEGPVLGVSWDGTGYGTDGTIWGGEFLATTARGFERVATLRRFRLPGGEQAVREPRRSALGVLYEIFGSRVREHQDLPPVATFSKRDHEVIVRMLERGVNAPRTSSAGRLFDAVSSLLDLRQVSMFEGQAAMELEWSAASHTMDPGYAFSVAPAEGLLELDWEPVIRAILGDRGQPRGAVAAKFHRALAELIVDIARRHGNPRVVLSGGCFQNRLLLECAVGRLEEEGFVAYWHQRVPPNDGGIALGQIYAAARAGEL
jgi:hydrogenase maturation protein HypF